MLALIKNNAVMNRLEIIGQFSEGGWVDIPDGSRVSPAYDGWSLRGYELHAIHPADPVLDGYQVVSSSVQIVDGLPKWVNVVQAVAPTSADVDAERDRRIALGFDWNGKHYQSRPEDIQNIDSMALAATSRIAQGQVDTGYRWFDPDVDFAWIAADNSLTLMNIEDMMNFAMVAAKWKSDNIRAGSEIKKTPGGIPANFATDGRWPNAPAG